MKKGIGTMMVLAAFETLCLGGDYEILTKLVAVAMLLGGAWMADLFDVEQPKTQAETNGYDKQDDHNPYPEE